MKFIACSATLALVLGFALSTDNALARSDLQPPARTVDVVDQIFGLTLPDPYRWMEGQKNPEFQTWLKAQGEAARSQLDVLPTLANWRGVLLKASAAGVRNADQLRVRDAVFFLRSSGSQTGVLMIRARDGTERVLLDPEKFNDSNGHASITAFNPSADGSKVAVNIDRNGNEISRIVVLEVATG